MFDARLVEGNVLKKLIDSIKDLVTSANFDCSSTGISLQAMDASHVGLITFLLQSEGFDSYRCDRNISLGINLDSFQKVLKSATAEDMITIKAKDGADNVTFLFEHPSMYK